MAYVHVAYVHEAAGRNDVESLRRLLEERPEHLEAVVLGGSGYRPLHFASAAGSTEAACYLLDRGAAINIMNGDGMTPLMLACQAGRAGVVAALLQRGADGGLAPQQTGLTALMYASFGMAGEGSDHVAVIRLLLKEGRVPVDARSKNGSTALWQACSYGYTERARVLLVEGSANPTLANYSAVTPMAAARRTRQQSCVQLLEWYKGELEKPFLFSKARAVVDAAEGIAKAAEKATAKTRAKIQKAMQEAREEAAPGYLRARVERGEALPAVEVVLTEGGEVGEEEECRAVCEFVVRLMKEDLFIELMMGLRYR